MKLFSPGLQPYATSAVRRGVSSILQVSCGLLCLAASGCQTLELGLSRDIVRVSTFYNNQRPWLNFDQPPTNVPQGFKCTVFLSNSKSALGCVGDGVLHVEMFRVDDVPGGQPVRTPIKKWSYDVQQAAFFRVKEPGPYGLGYGLRLNWDDADVAGREIVVVMSFERRDGVIIHGVPKYLKVPRAA